MKDLSYIAAMGMRLAINATNLICDCCCSYVQISYYVLDSMCLEKISAKNIFNTQYKMFWLVL